MNRSLLKFFLLVFALTIPVWLIGGIPLPGPSSFPLTLNVLIQPFVPLIAALVLVHREEGRGGVDQDGTYPYMDSMVDSVHSCAANPECLAPQQHRKGRIRGHCRPRHER